MAVIGWDIGGVNTKVARVDGGIVHATLSHPFEVQRDPESLAGLLISLAREVGAAAPDRHAVTMTAELSQMFRTKRDGVAFVLDAVVKAFGNAEISVYSVDGRFLSVLDAKARPLDVAASNWSATASVVALEYSDTILIDIGTTTTDIIPIVQGRVAATGKTDPDRLASGELVYTGALRTPVEAIVRHVPLGAADAGVSAEGFALIGDVHVWRNDLAPEDYTVSTPDARPATRAFARERIARVVCADREMLDDRAISRIADHVAAAQSSQVALAIRRVRARHPSLRSSRIAVVTGLGAFIADRAAREAGLTPIPLAETLGASAARSAPAAAVALLLERGPSPIELREISNATWAPNDCTSSIVDVVVKIGGGLLAHPAELRSVLNIVRDGSQDVRLAVVPGGGPFADAVRAADSRLALTDDAAHWMAVLAMDQYAHLLASLEPAFTLVENVAELAATMEAGRVPVIAPSTWVRAADPLPHSWDVTSDSISAWLATELGADRLVLVKPPRVTPDSTAVDPYFATAGSHLRCSIIAADATSELRAAIALAVND